MVPPAVGVIGDPTDDEPWECNGEAVFTGVVEVGLDTDVCIRGALVAFPTVLLAVLLSMAC